MEASGTPGQPGPSRIPSLAVQSPVGSKPGKSSIPSPSRTASHQQQQHVRKPKSILAWQGADVLGGQSDQSVKQGGKPKTSAAPVPSLNLAGVCRTPDEASTPSAMASKSPIMRLSTSPKTVGINNTMPATKGMRAQGRHSMSPGDAHKRRAAKAAGPTKVVFGRAVAVSPRTQKQHAAVGSRVMSSSILPAAGPILDKAAKPSRCTSVSKIREPAAPAAGLVQRSVSVDKTRLTAGSRSTSVERPRLMLGKSDSKFRAVSPSPAQSAEARLTPNPTRATVLLAAIPEAPRAAAHPIKPTAPAMANVNPRPVKPSFSLNLAAVKQHAAVSEQPSEGSLSGSSSMASQVPKLNLTPVLQQRDEEQGSQAYKVSVAPEAKPAAGSKSQVKTPDEPADHYYYYPKLDSKEERKTMELISSLPRQPANQMKKIYSAMVEAKQNCEAIAFRGHRLLDQLNTHLQEKLAKKEEEMAKHIRQVEEEMNKKLEAKEQEARRKEEELRRQADEFQRVKEQQEQRIMALYRQLQETQVTSSQGSVKPEQGASEEDSSAEMSQAAASALRDLKSMTANISSVQDSVSQLSSRLGGMAVRPGRGAALAGKDFVKEFLKPSGGIKGLALADDDLRLVKDVNS